jgi:hypothetical protein
MCQTLKSLSFFLIALHTYLRRMHEISDSWRGTYCTLVMARRDTAPSWQERSLLAWLGIHTAR